MLGCARYKYEFMEKTRFNQVGEVKGKLSEKEDSFSFQFTPQNENLLRTRGALFTLVTLESDEKEKLEKARAFYHAFQSSYYAKVSGSIINSLAETLDQVHTDIVKKEAQTGTNIAMVAAVFWGSILYLTKVGGSGVFVARVGKVKKLEFNKVVSGVLEDNDAVCLASERFLGSISEEELRNFLSEEKFEKVLEKIDERIAAVEGATCVVIRLSVNTPEDVPHEISVGEVDEKGDVDFPEKTESGEQPEETDSNDPDSKVSGSKESILNTLLQKAVSAFKSAKVLVLKVAAIISAKAAKPWRKNEPGEHVDHVAVRKQRIVQMVAVVVVFLILSIAFGIYSKGQTDKKEKIEQLFSRADDSLKKAGNLKNIDPAQAKSLVEKAKDSAKEADKLGADQGKINNIESKAASLLAEITRSYQVQKLSTVFDFTTINADAKLNKLALGGNLVVVSDKDNNSVYKYDLEAKAGSKIEGSFIQPENITAYQSGFYIQTKDGVTKVNSSGEKPAVAVSNSGWGTIVGAGSYQANLYLLDKDKGEVWRYFGTSKGLSSARAYLVGDKPSLAEASAIAIDDLVWVSTRSGTIYKFAQGKKQEFSLSNISDSFGDVVDLYTNSQTKNHYILDSGKARVVIVSKEGVFQAQYNHQELHKASSLVVNEEEKTIYFAANGKLYSFKFS